MTTLTSRWQQQFASTDYRQMLNGSMPQNRDVSADSGRVGAVLSDKFELSQADYLATEALLKKQMTESLASVGEMSNVQITSVPVWGYDPSAEELAVHVVRLNYQEGLEQGKSVEQLTRLVDDSAANIRQAYSKTSSILEAIGQLGPGQQSFLTNSENRVGQSIDKIHDDIAGLEKGNSDGKLFELSIQTREGDTVTVKFSSATGEEEDYGYDFSSFQVQYDVEGELSEEEHQALQAIFADVGAMADEYFKVSGSSQGGMAFDSSRDNPFKAEILKNFDVSQLSDVDLSMGHYVDGKKDDPLNDRLDYSYSVDERSQNQRLEVNWKPGMGTGSEFKIDTSLLGGKDPRQLAEYLALIDNNYQEVQIGQSKGLRSSTPTSLDMYKTALIEMFDVADQYTQLQQQASETFANGRQLVTDLTNQMIHNDDRYQALNANPAGVFNDGMSNLADFRASFTVAEDDIMGHMKIDMEQNTKTDKNLGLEGVEQNKSASTKTLRSYADAGIREVEQQENYQIKAAIEGQQVVAMDQERDIERHEFTRAKIHPGITSKTTVDTVIEDASSLRLIEDIWTQTVEHNKEETEDRKIFYGEELHSHSINQALTNESNMTVIGDLEKLKDNKFMREKYAPALARVNQFMLKV